MPGAMAPAAAAPKPQQPMSFNSNAPGSGAQVAGANYAMQNLQKAANLSGDTTQFQQQQLGQQLQNNQSNIAQSLTNRGLGNTTIANTMQQAPLQTYNMGMAQVGDLNAMRQMQAYGNLANAAMQGGNQITNTAQPYAQSNYANQLSQAQQLENLQRSMQQQGMAAQAGMQSDFMRGQGQQGQQQGMQGTSPGQQAMQQPLYFTPGQYGMGQAPANTDQLALAAQGYMTGVGEE